MHTSLRIAGLALAACVVSVPVSTQTPGSPARGSQRVGEVTLDLEDFVTMPITGLVDGTRSNEALLARVNTLREEVGGAKRLFISDLNGPLYILDKDTKKFTVYLDFNGTEGKNGLFRRFFILQGYGN